MTPRGPKPSDVAAAGNGGEIVDVVEYSIVVEALEQTQIEGGAANSAARKREAEMIMLVKTTHGSSPDPGLAGSEIIGEGLLVN